MNEDTIIIANDPDLNVLDYLWLKIQGLFDLPGQLTIFVLMVMVLIWTIHNTKKDRYLWNQVKAWSQSSIGAILLVVIFLYWSPTVMPEADQFGLYRSLLLRSASFLTGLFLITGGILFVGRVMPIGLISKVENATYGPTAVVCSIILGLVYLMTYS